MSRQEPLAHYYAQDAADQFGAGAVLEITISSKIWRVVQKMGAQDNVMMNSVWLETFVPTGPALGLFDVSSAKGIIRTYAGTP